MRIATAALAGAAVAGLLWTSAAQAQGVPPGSYRQSCSDARIEGGALVATCQAGGGGRAQRSSLPQVSRCTGDIGNNNGVLQCNYATGSARGTALPESRGAQQPGSGGPRYGEPAPGYGSREGYGERRYEERGYGREARERCLELRREAEHLRERLSRTYEPYERARVEGRLGEVRREEVRCR